jgi:hypothetical protein
VYDRCDMSVLARPLGVVVHRMIVHGDRLEGRAMGIRQSAAGGPEDLADAQVIECPCGDDQERIGVEVGNSGHRTLSALEMILDTLIIQRVIELVDVAEYNAAFASVSDLTTALGISQDGSIGLRCIGRWQHLPCRAPHQAATPAGRVSRYATSPATRCPPLCTERRLRSVFVVTRECAWRCPRCRRHPCRCG